MPNHDSLNAQARKIDRHFNRVGGRHRSKRIRHRMKCWGSKHFEAINRRYSKLIDRGWIPFNAAVARRIGWHGFAGSIPARPLVFCGWCLTKWSGGKWVLLTRRQATNN